MHQKPRKRFLRPIFISPKFGWILGADLADMKAHKYRSFRYILVLQDLHSRKILGLGKTQNFYLANLVFYSFSPSKDQNGKRNWVKYG